MEFRQFDEYFLSFCLSSTPVTALYFAYFELKILNFSQSTFHAKLHNGWNDCLIDMKSTQLVLFCFICLFAFECSRCSCNLEFVIKSLLHVCMWICALICFKCAIPYAMQHCSRWWLWIGTHNQQTILQSIFISFAL